MQPHTVGQAQPERREIADASTINRPEVGAATAEAQVSNRKGSFNVVNVLQAFVSRGGPAMSCIGDSCKVSSAAVIVRRVYISGVTEHSTRPRCTIGGLQQPEQKIAASV